MNVAVKRGNYNGGGRTGVAVIRVRKDFWEWPEKKRQSYLHKKFPNDWRSVTQIKPKDAKKSKPRTSTIT